MRKKKFIAILLLCVFILGLSTTGAVAKKVQMGADFDITVNDDGSVQVSMNFKDMDQAAWALKHVYRMKAEDIISGYRDGTFRPNKPVTRAEAVVMTMKAAGFQSEIENTVVDSVYLPFKDAGSIPDWAQKSIALAVKKQFIEGSVSGNFQSSKPATREWAIKLIIKSMGLQQEAAAKAGVDLPFRDRDIIPDDAVGYIAVALENGIITGFPDGTFKPNKPVTRAQIATMLGSTASELPIPGKLKNKVEGTVLSVSTVPAVVSETVYERTYSQGTITIDTGKEDDDEDEDRDEDEDEDEDEDNRVTGTVTYPVAANALIYVDGRKASLDLVAVGAEAELVVKNGLAVFIEVEPVTVKGVVYAVYAPENRLDIMPKEREKRMIIRSYTVADNGVIMLNGTDSALTEILPGDVVKLTLDKDGKAAQVKATRLLKPEKVRDKDEEKERHRERDKEKNRDRGQDKMKDKNDDNDEHEEDD